MIKVPNNTEFVAFNKVWVPAIEDGKMKFKFIREFNGKENNNPTLEEVKEFFKSKGYSEESAAKFHDYYSDDTGGQWKDSNDKIIKDWRKKAKSVWFVPKNEIPKEQPKQEKKESKFLFGD